MDKIISIRKGGEVKRFHTVTMLREHLVSSHSWGVAVIAQDIYPSCSKNLILAALYHDVAEHVTGDVSAVTKWRYPELKDTLDNIERDVEKDLGVEVFLSEHEQLILKFADMADLILCCVTEYRLGNLEAFEIVRRGLTYLEDRAWTPECRAYLPKVKRYVEEMTK